MMSFSLETLGVSVLAGLLATLAGCQTTSSEENVAGTPSSRIAFVPTFRQAPIQAGEGRYPDLFTGASHANWGAAAEAPVFVETPPTESVPAPVATQVEAEKLADLESVPAPPVAYAARAGGLTIECYLESEFPDRSIAYDAVGLRGMEITLKLPGGGEIQPAQKRLDADLRETPVGALRRYSRKLTLYFPESEYLVENPALNPDTAGMRLVLSGHESIFYFEWPATPDFAALPETRPGQEVMDTTRAQLRKARGAVQRASHNFD